MQHNHPLIPLRLELGNVRAVKASARPLTNSVECEAESLSRYDIELLQRIANKHVAVMSMTAKSDKIIVNFSISEL